MFGNSIYYTCKLKKYKIESEDTKMMNLTKMEKMVLNALRNNDYNDCYTDPCTWAFAAIDYSTLNAKQARGVMASLIKKGLMGFQEDKDDEDLVWLTDEGKALFENATGEECNWGGPRLLEIEEVEEEVEREEKTMTVKEMRAEAKKMGIKGYSRMSKKDLQTVIAAAKSVNEFLGKSAEAKTEEKTTVTVRAFTGMLIGKFEVVRETKKLLVVKTKKGDELKFDKATGLQTNGNNPKFANRIEL